MATHRNSNDDSEHRDSSAGAKKPKSRRPPSEKAPRLLQQRICCANHHCRRHGLSTAAIEGVAVSGAELVTKSKKDKKVETIQTNPYSGPFSPPKRCCRSSSLSALSSRPSEACYCGRARRLVPTVMSSVPLLLPRSSVFSHLQAVYVP